MPPQSPSFRIALRALIAACGLLLALVAAIQFFPGLPTPFRKVSRGKAQPPAKTVLAEVATDVPDVTDPADDSLESPFSGSVISDQDLFIPDSPPPADEAAPATIELSLNQDRDSEPEPVPLPPVDEVTNDSPPAMLRELRKIEQRIGELERRTAPDRGARAEKEPPNDARLAKLLQQVQAQTRDVKTLIARVEKVEQQAVTAATPAAETESKSAPRVSIRSVEEDGSSRWVIQARDASLPELLARLGEATGMNLLVAPDVSGTVSLHLSEPDGNAALEAVCKIYRCHAAKTGNFVVISKDGSAESTEKPKLPETISKLYRLKYLSGSELRPYVQPLLTPGLGTFGFASIRERVARTTYRNPPRAVLVKDTARVLEEIDRMIQVLDRPSEQGLELPPPGEPLPERVVPNTTLYRELFDPPLTSENPIRSRP